MILLSDKIIIYEDHIDKDTIRDDILSEMFEKMNSMDVQELISLRNIVFKNEKPEIELKTNHCSFCKLEIDRDFNASINIHRVGASTLAGGPVKAI